MKVKCEACGKKEAEVMSKFDIKRAADGLTNGFKGVDTQVVSKIVDILDNLFSPKYIVCKSCGHIKEA